MPSNKNQQALTDIEAKIDSAKAIFLASYSGLSVKDQQTLRAKVKEAGGELKVTKNTLMKLALKNRGIDTESIASELEGHNITLYAGDDPVSPLKVIVDFARDNEKPVLKTGLLGKEILSLEKIEQLASLPSKLELIAKLIGQIQAPIYGFVNILSGPTRSLVYALSAIRDQKQSNS